jgi:hypothetical protein
MLHARLRPDLGAPTYNPPANNAIIVAHLPIFPPGETWIDTDAELWEQFVNIEEEFADEDEAMRGAAHRAAGTFGAKPWPKSFSAMAKTAQVRMVAVCARSPP